MGLAWHQRDDPMFVKAFRPLLPEHYAKIVDVSTPNLFAPLGGDDSLATNNLVRKIPVPSTAKKSLFHDQKERETFHGHVRDLGQLATWGSEPTEELTVEFGTVDYCAEGSTLHQRNLSQAAASAK